MERVLARLLIFSSVSFLLFREEKERGREREREGEMPRGERSAHGGFGIVALTGFFSSPLFFFLRRERQVAFNSLIGVMGLEVCGNESGGRRRRLILTVLVRLYVCCASRKCKRKLRFIFVTRYVDLHFYFSIHGRIFAKFVNVTFDSIVVVYQFF